MCRYPSSSAVTTAALALLPRASQVPSPSSGMRTPDEISTKRSRITLASCRAGRPRTWFPCDGNRLRPERVTPAAVSLPAHHRSVSAARLLAVLVAGLLVLGPQSGATAADTNIAVGSEPTASSVEN